MVVVPRGPASDSMREIGMEVHNVAGLSQFDNTDFGYYRGLRWLILWREIAFLFPTVWSLFKMRKHRKDIDLVHVNELTLTPVIVLTKLMLGKPVVAHARSVQRSDLSSRRTRLVRYVLRRWTDAVIAIDEIVRRSLPAGIGVHIVHNCFAMPGSPLLIAPLELPHRAGSLRVGYIGGLVPVKGLMDLLEAVEICVDRGVNVEVVVAGENPRPTSGLKGVILRRSGVTGDYRREIDAYISAHRLGAYVHMVGLIKDVPRFYRSIDLLCFPSRVEATGRPVIEAGLFGIPSIVTLRDSPGDTFIDGVTGISIPRQDPLAMADAIEQFSRDRAKLREMGAAARQFSESRFQPAPNAEKLVGIYRETLEGRQD